MKSRPSTARTKVAFEALHYVQLEAARRKEKGKWLDAQKQPKPPAKKRKATKKK
jgi:hypothetical protein